MALIDEKRNQKIQTMGKWIDKVFLEELLRDKLNTAVTIGDFKVSAAVAEGENYFGTLYKVEIKYTTEESNDTKELRIIIKGLPEMEQTIESAHDLHAFERETCFYTVIHPKMRELIDKYLDEGPTSIAAEEYNTNRHDTIVMEDLTQDGYKMKPRIEQFDYEHCLAVLQKLALMHALSVKVYEEDPTLIAKTAYLSYSDEARTGMGHFVETGMAYLAESVESWKEFEDSEEIAGKLKKLLPFIYEKMQAIDKAEGKYKVLAHGDLWVNNIMFKYDDDGKVCSVKFVDYQFSRRTSLAFDVLNMLFSSARAEVLSKHIFDLMSKYYDSFSHNLTALGVFTLFDYKQFHQDIRSCAVFAVYNTTAIAPFVLAPGADEVTGTVMDVGIFDDHPGYMLGPVFQTQRYKNYAIDVLRLLNRIGYLDEAATNLQYVVDEMMKKQSADSDSADVEVSKENADEDTDKEVAMRMQPIAEKVSDKEKDANEQVANEIQHISNEGKLSSVNKMIYEESKIRAMSAHERTFFARAKSAVRGVFRKFMEI